MKSFFNAAGALALAFLASSTSALQMEQDVQTFQAPNWVRGARVTEKDSIPLTFYLKHDEVKKEAFDALFDKITNPKDALYGKYLTIDQITNLIGLSEADLSVVTSFLELNGVKEYKINRNNDQIRMTIPAKLAEKMFNTELYHYNHAEAVDLDLIRTGAPYHLPDSVAEKVSMVGEMVRLPRVDASSIQPASSNLRAGADPEFGACGLKCSGKTTPAVLQARYGYPSVSSVQKGNSMAVAEFQFQYYDDTDLTAFGDACGVAKTGVDTVYGGNLPGFCKGNRCVEALLDIEYINAVAQPIPLSVYYSTSYSILDWAQSVGDNTKAELVHSISYGNDEAQQTSTDYMYSVNTELQKLGARGLSVLVASGDQGAWGREEQDGNVFHPDFPASSPFITAVGGTDFLTASTIGDEKAWQYGGGGFSNTFDIPSWQADAVAQYQSQRGLPPSALWNSTGRGYPDVSALAGTQNGYCVSYNGDGSFAAVGGTSASCPVVAGIISILNNIRLSEGKAPLGFLNPWLYQNADAFYDVTNGNNQGDGNYGFPATSGWDAATGLGTPNFDVLKTRL